MGLSGGSCDGGVIGIGNSLVADFPTKLLQPTSSKKTLVLQPSRSALAASSQYLRLLHSTVSSTASSQGTVSLTMWVMWSEEDQSMGSGLRLVLVISAGKLSL